ncbi:MAG: PEP-CTERM sorting domain-containing protein [Verrucomicrobiia bacterium]
MKHLSLVAVGVGCLLFQSAYATLLFSDGFNYTAGSNLGGNVNPGSGDTWGTGGATNIQVGTGNLTYSGLNDLGGNDLQMVWGTASSDTNGFANITSGTIYYSFLLDVTTAPSGNLYLTSLNPGTSAPNGSSDAITLYLATVTGGGAYRLGIRGGGASAVYTPSGSPYSLGTTYIVVLGYNFNGGVANNNLSLWVDPTLGGSAPTATLTLTPTTVATGIDDVGFKSQAGTGTMYVDNLLVGTTWSDVTPTPEPATFALAGLGVLGLLVARRMRR